MREILMIDDEFSKWYPILEKSAGQHDFNITNAPNIEEGLGKLGNYAGNIEAVILGLSFANGKMQGKEGIIKIKEIDNFIPVIIVATQTSDIQLISECIRLGALDYFSKQTINPGILFLQIEMAIRQSNQRKKLLNITKTATDPDVREPYFHFSAQNKVPKGYFAYKLNAVASSSFENKNEAEFLCKMAFDWHFNFLNTLTFYDSRLTLRLRYLFQPGKEFIDPFLLIEFDTSSYEEAIVKFNEIHQEFDLLMQAKKGFGKTIYYFSPIIDEFDLLCVMRPFPTEDLIQFTPEFPNYSSNHLRSIGFYSVAKDYEEKKITFPSLLKPEIRLDGFCEQLFHQKTRTMVELVLSPVKLSLQEIDHLRELSDNINSYYFNDSEKENAIHAISLYLQAPSKCFNVEVFETQESKKIGENLLSAISSAFFESATQVKAISVKYVNDEILEKENRLIDNRDWNSLYTLNNIVNIFKFPYPFSPSMPGIRSYQPIFGFIPENITKTGVTVGTKNIGGNEISIKIAVEDLRKHLYILGQTGTGKTTVLYSMIMDRIRAGKGVCVIDPHGDLHQKILENLPVERRKDLIRFEPGNPDNTIRINLLEYNRDNPQEKSFLIDELFNFFRQEYEMTTMGPMFEMFMKNTLLLLMDDPDDLGSIGHVTHVFQNSDYRSILLQKCKDRDVVDFWENIAVNLTGDQSLANFTPYIVSKLNQLLMNEYIKPIIDTKVSNINFRDVVDNDKILLVSLSKGKIGKIGVNILGTVILSRIINAAMSRENIPEEERKDVTLFVDEFQNFVSQSVMSAMSEARKYRLSMVLANQTLGQLKRDIVQSVLGNVGSTIFFRPGINDVDYIMPYFTPYLTRENVLTLPNFKCIGRLQIDNMLSLPFIFDTIQPEDGMNIIQT